MPSTHNHPYQPIRLKDVLVRHGISQTAFGDCIRQPSGRPLSRAAVNILINHGLWPVATPRDAIETAAAALLRERGVSEQDIATAWEPADQDRRNGQPVHFRIGGHRYGPRAPSNATPEDHEEPETHEMLTAEARRHFSLFRDPFQDDVQGADDVYLSADQRYIREAMFTTAKHGGFVAVVGESGAGKTILRKDLIERINREGQAIVLIQPQIIDKTRLTAGMIFHAIIDDLAPGTPVRSSPEAKARQAQKMLTESSRAGNAHVLVIEEAHDLSTPTLKALKRFWELEDGFKRLLSIILIGQPELKLRLDENHNWEAREVIRRCEVAELMPLDRNLEEYLALKFRRVGAELGKVFTGDAFDAMRAKKGPQMRPGGVVARPSQLYPLVVNNLVIRAMNAAAALGAPVVDGDVIRSL